MLKKGVFITLSYTLFLIVSMLVVSAAVQFPTQTAVNNTNPKKFDVVQISVNATNSTGASSVSIVIFSWNGTLNGQWVNASNSSYVDQESINYTVNLSVLLNARNVVGYQFYANDSAGAFSNTTLQTFTVEDTAGSIFSTSINNSAPKINEIVQFGSNLSDPDIISMAIFEWNATSNGRYANATNSSVVDMQSLNFTANLTNPLTRASIISWRFYFNDSGATWTSGSYQQFTVANTPPSVPVILVPSSGIHTKSQPLNLNVAFTGDADNDLITIYYYINGKLNQTSLTNTTLNASDGSYILNVSLYDGFGFSSNATVNFSIDATAPAFIATSLNNSNPKRNDVVQIGVKASDATNTSMVLFSWNGTSNGVWVNASNSSVVNSDLVNYTVNQSITLPQGNVIGYTFYANDSLNTFGSAAVQTFAVANTLPSTPTILEPTLNNYTNLQPLSLRVTFPADVDNDVLSINYYINGRLNQTSLTNTTLNASDGYYILNVSLSDTIGTSANASVNFTIDTLLPTILELKTNDTDNITRNNVVLNFTVISSDTNFFNVTLNGTLMSPIGGNVYRLTSNASDLGCVNDGNCLLNATAVDLAGNKNSTIYTLTIDNTAPSISDLKSENDTDNITRSDNVINFTVALAEANINSVILNGTSMSQGTGVFYLVTTPSALGCANGHCLLAATALDKADNINTASYTLTVDNLNPGITLLTPQNKANISGVLNLTVTVTDLIANISSVKAINGTTIYSMSLISGTEGNGIYNLTIDSRNLPNGAATFKFNATDKAGNYNDTLEVNITMDNMKPKVLAFNGFVINNVTVARNVTVNVTTSDNITGIKNLIFYLNGTNNTAINPIKDGNNFTALLETKNFTDGFYNITAIPEDYAGNKEIDHLLISEILFDPAGSDSGAEWVELYNPTNLAINITNWDIRSKSGNTVTFNFTSTIIPPKSSIVVGDNATKFNSTYGFFPDIDGTKHISGFSFTNSNDFAQLRDSSNVIIDEVSWGGNADGTYNWSLFADENYSIARNPVSGDVDQQYDWNSNKTMTPSVLSNPNHITIKIDNTPPQIVSFNGNAVSGAFLKGPITMNATVTDALSAVSAVIFTVSGSGSATLNLSASQEQSFWNATLDTAKLADGKYNISVFANDTLSNINNTEFIEVTIDNNPPIVSNLIPPNLSFVNETSILVSFVLKDNTTGVNTSGSAVQLNYTLDGIGPFTATLNAPVALSQGFNFSVTINTVNAKEANLTVTSKDNNSNVMPTAKWSFMVDLVKPFVNNIQINDTDKVLRSIDVVNITLNSSNSLAGIKNVTVGSSINLGMTNAYSTIWQIVASLSSFGCTSDGLCTLAISSEDNAGNINNSESIKLTIDNTNPQVNNIVINNTIVSNITPVKINLSINDVNFAIGTVTASNASSVSLSNATTAPYWIANTNASALGCQQDGNCRITIKAIDSVGNTNISEIVTISVDSSPPSISTVAINDSNNIVQSADILNMSVTVTDSNAIVSITGNSVNFSQTGSFSIWSAVNKSSNFCSSEGLCKVEFTTIDNLSNSNSTQNFTFTIDNTAPELSDFKINITNNITTQISVVNFSIIATDTNNISKILLNFTPLLKLNDTVWSTVNNTSSLCQNEGNCSLQFTATDNAGNTQSLPLRVLIDSFNPQFSNPTSMPTVKHDSTNATLNVTWSDPNGIASVSFKHNATGGFQSYIGVPQDGYYILIINSSQLKNQMIIGWNSSAFDIAGNLNESMPLQTFKVENRAPAFMTIPNITAQEDTNATLELSSFYSDPDSDNLTYSVVVLPENITVIINSTNGSVKLVPIANLFGERYVIFNASDGLNHTVGNNVTINFTNVNDAPVVSAIPDIVFNEDSYNDSIMLDDFVSDVDTSDSQITWTASSLSSNISIIITANRIMNVSAIGNYSGTSIAFVTANDGTTSKQSNVFTIIVNPVNDAPTTPTLTSPVNNSVFSKTNITLSWQASKDNESSTITYYLFNSNDTAPKVNASTTSTTYTMENLSVGKTYYWAVLASDGSLNSSSSDIRQYNITANIPPNITEFFPTSTQVTMQENQSQKFNITKTDPDNNIINVTWYIDGILNLTLADTLNYTTNISSAGLHNISVVVIDFFRANASTSWLVNVTNLNQAPTLSVPEGQLNASEDNPFIFNITGADFDNDILTFASNRSDVKVTKFSYTAVINWTPTNDDVGNTTIKFNVTDTSNLPDTKIVFINVSNVNDAPAITSFFPSENPKIAELTGEQIFNVTATDPDVKDTITITWRLNGVVNRTGDTYKAGNLSAAMYNVTANVTDGNLSVIKAWNMTVTATPVSDQYVGTIFSLSKDKLENATNVTINHTTLGNIDFGNNTLNLSGVVDIDSVINISKGVTAIDTEKVPKLNKSARIVWKTLNFTKSPFIYFNQGFKAEGNTSCPTDVCTNITYDKATGILSFNVAHFSTFFAAANTSNDPPRITSTPPSMAVLNDPLSYSVTVADLDNTTFIFTLPTAPSGMSISSNGVASWTPNTLGKHNVTINVSDGIASDAQSFTLEVTEGARLRISDLDVKIDGKTSKNLRNNSVIRREAEPGSDVEFRIKVKNGFSSKDDMEINDIETEVTIESIDDGDDLEFEADDFDLKEAKDKTVKADFDIPLAVDEDTFDVIIKVNGEDENGTAHNVEWKLQLEVDKESHKLIVDKPSLNPPSVSCNRNTVLSASVVNVGSDEESDVQLAVESEPLEISQSEKDIFLDSGTEDISHMQDFSIKVRDDLAAGTYPIQVKAYRDSKLEDTKTINLKVDDCIVEKKKEVKEKVVVVKPTSAPAPDKQFQIEKPTREVQKPALKAAKPTKVPFRETDEYVMLLIAIVVTLTVGVFVVGSLMVFRMRR